MLSLAIASLCAERLYVYMKDIIKPTKENNTPQPDSLLPPQIAEAIDDMQEKLDLAGDELQRMEFESGNPLKASQSAEIANYSDVSKCIKKKLLKNKQT